MSKIMQGSKRADGSLDFRWYPEYDSKYLEARDEADLHRELREGGVTSFTFIWNGEDFEVHTVEDQINLRIALEDLGAAIRYAREDEQAAMVKLIETLPTALANGISEVQAAKLTGLDRGTIRRALGK